MRLSIGVIIAIILIIYWWRQDHPSTIPLHQGNVTILEHKAA